MYGDIYNACRFLAKYKTFGLQDRTCLLKDKLKVPCLNYMEVCIDSVEAALNAEKGGKFLVYKLHPL